LQGLIVAGAKDVEALQDESTAELQQKLAEIETHNQKVEDNFKYVTADAEADALRGKYEQLSRRLRRYAKKSGHCWILCSCHWIHYTSTMAN
jgi:hypothetical protein